MPVLDNDKHERFCGLVAIGTPYTTAYMQSGFTAATRDVACVNACRLVREADIKARIEEIKLDIGDVSKEDFGVTRAWLVQILERNVAIAFGIEPYATVMEAQRDAEGKVKRDENGEVVMLPTSKYRYEPAAANKSLEMLGQLKGEFRKEMTLRGDPNAPIVTRLAVDFVGPVADALIKGAHGG